MNKPLNQQPRYAPMNLNGHSRPATYRVETAEQARKRKLRDAYVRLMTEFAKDAGVHVAGVSDVLARATVIGTLHKIGECDSASLGALRGVVFHDTTAERLAREKTYAAASVNEIQLNPKALRTLPLKEQQRMLAHECAHIILRHPEQRFTRDDNERCEHEAWALALKWID